MWPAILGGAASLLGGMFSNQASAREAKKNRDFQRNMSNTAVQRSVEDYRSAGLNPALAYDGTASTPGGATASSEDPVEKGVSSALAAKRLQADIGLIKAQTDKTNSEKANVDADLWVKTGVIGEGEPSWRDEVMSTRAARMRDNTFTGTMQPHELARIKLANSLAAKGMNRAELFSSLFGSARGVSDFVRDGVGQAGDAGEALAAWMEAVRSQARGRTMKRTADADASARAAKKRLSRNVEAARKGPRGPGY